MQCELTHSRTPATRHSNENGRQAHVFLLAMCRPNPSSAVLGNRTGTRKAYESITTHISQYYVKNYNTQNESQTSFHANN